MSLSLIAAIGQNRELGKDNHLVFDIPGDLKFFKEVTLGHPIFMGLNTWKSLPKKLPGRKHYVLCYPEDNDTLPLNDEDFFAVNDLEAFLKEWQDKDEEMFVIGGAGVYHQTAKYCDKLYLTEVDATADADAFFPEFDKTAYDKTIIRKGQDDDLTYTHVLYTKK